jgi:AraC-like DNA-binding protein
VAEAPAHRCRVLGSPWPGVYATDIDSGRHYGRHWHATYGLGLMDAGAHRSSSSRGAVEAFAGDIVATNPGEVHDGRPLGGPSRRWRTVYLEPEVVASLAAGSGGRADVAFDAAAFGDARLRRVLQRLLRELDAWSAGGTDALACEEALVLACGLMLRDHASTPPPADAGAAPLPRVLERLADDAARAPTLAELAHLAGLGPFQLLRRFRAAHGTTPHAWLLQHRAERARALIAQGRPLADAAASCGFADQPHLTRVFVQRFGFTPGAWRAAVAPQSRSRR